jgi:hypothetical protein
MVMETFAPEFSQFWLADVASKAPGDADERPDVQQAALEELVDRVNAARSIA